MDDWVADLLIFCAGIAGGVLVTSVKPFLSAARRRRTRLVAARSRMLADLKEKHDEEILEQAFRTTEAIKGELDKSLDTLRKTLAAVTPAGAARKSQPDGTAIQLSDRLKVEN